MSTTKPNMSSSLEPDHPSVDDGLESQDLSLRQAIRVIRSRYRFILAAVFVCLATIALLSAILPVKYESTSTIELKQDQSELSGSLGEVASSITGGSDLKVDLKTAEAIFKDPALGREVVERMHFADKMAAGKPLPAEAESSKEASTLPLQDDVHRNDGMLGSFEGHLDIKEIPGTRLMQVTYKDRDPKFAADVANATVDQYIKDTLRRRNASTSESTEWMSGQLDALRKQVEAAQANLADFQKRSGFIVVPSGGGGGGGGSSGGGGGGGGQLHSTLLDRLDGLNAALVQAQAARIAQEATYRVLKTGDPAAIDAFASTSLSAGATSGGASAAGTSGPSSTSGGSAQSNMLSALVALHQQEIALKQQLAAAYQTYGAKNPHVIDLHNQIDYLDTEIRDETARTLSSAKTSLDIAEATEAQVKDEVKNLEHEADAINDSGVRLAVLQQEADSSRALYEDLYTKLEESRLAEETQSANVLVISEATPSGSPTFPKWGLNLTVAGLIGLVLGIMLAFLRESLDETISSSPEIEALTHVPVIGIIPKFEQSAVSKGVGPDTVASETGQQGGVMGLRNSEAGEAYRELRTTIQLSQAGSPPRTLLVTSPLPSEGKSTTCYNLAAGFALLNKRVLLLDADMRKPSLHKRTGIRPTKGLSSLLTSNSELSSLVHPIPGVENLFFLGAGPLPPNPAELLMAPPFAKLLADAASQFDILIIDSPPALMVSDSSIISTSVDGVVIVACAGRSKRTPLLRTLKNLRRHHAKILGVVLNMVNTKSSDYYYAYGYYGGKYYGEESNEDKKF